ncbi:glycosyltransferase [Limosilactobacillus fastidiosus]|uniref:Glycosyltransferase n=1 Tax=Limosilactobacillus fastidiosus TaxID=2759855 RepID=A0A7W3TY01_9LACO|nr:glycosyltransferase [Limosilactobacillus fastidiosus]MBB1085348.1 glycosyltransferase [Limosilactobacillus fastidiosus]MCD7084959.1 glycosyltransferase [Limosilactobacillus fastidiosus]MCD7113763.1 glycosyltransferase [Limosilactobacillus fastidiosus]MCD7115421.1 glycosyltransferase [Limosilactobacillus fastidiosus]
MKKVLVVGDFISGSGLTQVIFNVFSRFSAKKYEIEAVGYGIDPEKVTEKKCQKLGWQFYRVIPVTKNPLKHWQWWKTFFKEHHYDIIYFNYSSSWNYLPVIYAKRYGKVKKIVCHSHNSYFSHEFSNKLLMRTLVAVNNHGKKIFDKYADQKIATSKEAARWMFNEDKDVFISINGIDIPKFSFSMENREDIRNKLNIDTQTKLIGFVGVLQERKNPLFALDVFVKYHKLNPNSKFLMLGKGPLKEQINEKIQALGIRDSVIQYDFIADVNRWYSAMDALLFPSMYEGLSLVALESQISNLQILASDTNVEDIFATSNIKKMHGLNVAKWASELEDSLGQDKNRDYLDSNLEKFSVDRQAEDIEKLM